MVKPKSDIARQLKLFKITKLLVVFLLGVSFALEFVMLNLISTCKEQKVVTTVSHEQWVAGGLVAVTDTISVTISQEFQDFIDYVRKKHEEQNRSQAENHQFTAFHLFFVDKFSFHFEGDFCLEMQALNAFYQEPFTQKHLSEIFHPPQV